MAATKYQDLLSTLTNAEFDTGKRFRAALELAQNVDESSETAALAAKDLKNIMQVFQDATEMTLSQATFDVLFTLAQKKGLKEDFAKADFPRFCADHVDKDEYRLKSTHMVLSLLRENQMVTEMVQDVGIIEILLKYSDHIDKMSLAQRPQFLLKTRRFIFLSLLSISEDEKFTNLLIEKGVLEKVKTCCLKLTLADELSRLLPPEVTQEIRKDENVLHASGLDILFNLAVKFENYKRKDQTIRAEEVKYLYDYDSDHELTLVNNEGKAIMSVKKKEQWNNAFSEEEDSAAYKSLLQQISETRLVEDVLEAAIQQHPVPSLHGLRILYRLASVVHLIISVEFRAAIVNSLLGIASRISGQRRHNCFSCLLVLSRHVENSNMFVSTSVFRSLFYLGMEESGEVLNQLLKVLRSLSVHTSTAEEMAVRSECPKLFVKVMHEDFKGLVEYPANGTDAEKGVALDKTPAVCLLTIFNLIQKSRECKEAMVEAGVVEVLSKIAMDHPSDLIGMMALTSIATLSAFTKMDKIPAVQPEMVDLLLDALDCCLSEKAYENLLFPTREICLCFESLARERGNCRAVARGLPLFAKAFQVFVDEFAKEKAIVSARSAKYLSKVLQQISSIKSVLNKMVELGTPFLDLLTEAEEYVSETNSDDVFDAENSAAMNLQYVRFAIEDELNVCKVREEAGDDLRKSSRISWAKIFGEKKALVEFMALKRFAV